MTGGILQKTLAFWGQKTRECGMLTSLKSPRWPPSALVRAPSPSSSSRPEQTQSGALTVQRLLRHVTRGRLVSPETLRRAQINPYVLCLSLQNILRDQSHGYHSNIPMKQAPYPKIQGMQLKFIVDKHDLHRKSVTVISL